jgi:hypothetical protein
MSTAAHPARRKHTQLIEEDLMNRGVFYAMTRRASFITLGTAGLAALAHPITTDAKKNRKKNRNEVDVNKLCKKQVGQCIDALTVTCEDDPECLEDVERCCPLLKDCDFEALFACGEGENSMRRLARKRSTS